VGLKLEVPQLSPWEVGPDFGDAPVAVAAVVAAAAVAATASFGAAAQPEA